MSKKRAFHTCVWLSLIVLVFSRPGFAVTPDRVNGIPSSGKMVALHGYVQHDAAAQYDIGLADPGLHFGSIMLQTTPTARQQKALMVLLAEQQDRKSPHYHKWLTPEQWADRFGLSPNDVKQITGWLKSQGFTGIQVAHGRNWFTFEGSAAQVQQAFGTEIHRFDVRGEMHVANATSPKMPAALAGIVTGIRGLDDFFLRPRAIHKARPLYYDSSLSTSYIAPGDIATLYDINALYTAGVDGTGQKIAVIGQTDVFLADLTDFRTAFGLSPIICPTNSNGVITACNDSHFQYVPVIPPGGTDPGVPITSGALSEADLDIEWSGATAPNAQIVYVNAPTNNGSTISGGAWPAWYAAVDQDLAPVISMSYGNCEFLFPYSVADSADEAELRKANSEGITFVSAGGDSGAAACDPNPSPNSRDKTGYSATFGWAATYPASSPEVTAVGATSFSLSNLANSTYWGTTTGADGGSILKSPGYVPEQAWNDNVEIAQSCQQNATMFCTQGGNSAVSGWQSITSAQIAQEDLSLISANGIESSGGGPSNCAMQSHNSPYCLSGFPTPSWQSSISVPGQTGGTRYIPDVSMFGSANFPGYIFCTDVSELGDPGSGSACAQGISAALALPVQPLIGGTSAATPVFAGIVALLNQKLSSTGQGNINPTLYQIAATTSNNAFHQVTSGTNMVACTTGTPSNLPPAFQCPNSGMLGYDASQADTATGYNLVTGLGSIDANNLFTAWAATATSFTMSAGTLNPASVAAGASASSTVTIAPQNGFNGGVTLSCSGLPSGATCSFNPTTATQATGYSSQLTISTPPTLGSGTSTVTVTGTAASSATNSTTVSLVVTPSTESFSLSTNLTANTLTLTQGASGPIQLTVSSTSGFVVNSGGGAQTAAPVTYTCSGLPNESQCLVSPASPTTATLVTVTVVTTAPHAQLQRPFDRGPAILFAALLPGFLGIAFTVGSRKRSLRGLRILGLIMVFGVSTMWLASCGGGGKHFSDPGTPVGNSTVTINATTGGTSSISSSISFTLTVN